MLIYNNNNNISKRVKFNTIQRKNTEEFTSSRTAIEELPKNNNNKTLTRENSEFLTQLGFKIKKQQQREN